jgi:hypothetical protein
MAAVSSSSSLSSSFADGGILVGAHVWLDLELGLVTGDYPNPSAKFDFGEEKLIPIVPEKMPAAKKRISHLAKARRVVKCYELETDTEIHVVGSATQLLIEGLNLLERIAPGTLEAFSLKKGRTKRAVAKTREELYDVPHPLSHSEKLASGFYVATNNKDSEARGYLMQAVEIAGLTWGKNFTVRSIKK